MNNLIVRCYSGYTYAEEPRSFEWGGVEYEIEKIEKTWQRPGEKCFQVSTMDSTIFELCYNEMEEEWAVTEVADFVA